MKSFRRLLLLSGAVLALAACASAPTGPTPQQVAANQASTSFQPLPGQAGLYIFKEETLVNVTESSGIFIDGQPYGLLASNAVLYAPLMPGQHIVSSAQSTVNLNAVAGQNYYIRQKMKVDATGALLSSTLVQVPAAKGQAIVHRIQLEGFSR
jgi:hypothetical protein